MFARKDLNFIKLQMQVSVKGHHGGGITIFNDFEISLFKLFIDIYF